MNGCIDELNVCNVSFVLRYTTTNLYVMYLCIFNSK